MVCKRVEAGARTSQVVRARSFPYVVTSDINMLILVENRERETGRASLSLLICCVFWYGSLFVEVPFQVIGIFEGLLSIRAQCMSGRCEEKTCERIGQLHLDFALLDKCSSG